MERTKSPFISPYIVGYDVGVVLARGPQGRIVSLVAWALTENDSRDNSSKAHVD